MAGIVEDDHLPLRRIVHPEHLHAVIGLAALEGAGILQQRAVHIRQDLELGIVGDVQLRRGNPVVLLDIHAHVFRDLAHVLGIGAFVVPALFPADVKHLLLRVALVGELIEGHRLVCHRAGHPFALLKPRIQLLGQRLQLRVELRRFRVDPLHPAGNKPSLLAEAALGDADILLRLFRGVLHKLAHFLRYGLMLRRGFRRAFPQGK